MKKIFLLLCLVTGISFQNAKAQDVHFSQFYENAVLRNPALTGIFTGDYKIGVNYRNQWSGFATPFNTLLINGETKIPMNNNDGDVLSAGLSIYYDKAGTINFNSLGTYGALNYNKALNDTRHTFVSVGLAVGYIQRSMDVSKMTFGNQYTVGYQTGSPVAAGESVDFKTIRNFDVVGGISINSGSLENNGITYYLGVAGYHVQKPQQSFRDPGNYVRLGSRWAGAAGLNIAVNERVRVLLHANVQLQHPYREVIGGGMLSYSSHDFEKKKYVTVFGGCYYRLGDAVIPTIKLEYRKIGFVFSYDVSLGGNRIYINKSGGFEFTIYLRDFFKNQIKATDATLCPRFEEVNNW